MKPITDFEDIRPFYGEEFHEKIVTLLQEPYFRGVIMAIMPGVNYDEFSAKMLTLRSAHEFQEYIIKPWLMKLAEKTSDGFTYKGTEHIDREKGHLFMSNHRDIVLDATYLCVALLNEGLRSCEVAIGSNLLIYNWISDLVRINGCFTVKRGVGVRQALEAAHQLSAYIHHTITERNTSVWIAQREGRTKDSNDRTQESLIKMLGLETTDNLLKNLTELNFTPVSISYEYDPCDSLKAYEFLQKSKNPDFKKEQKDDLKNMEVGIMGYKGRIHFCITPSIKGYMEQIDPNTDKAAVLQKVVEIIDRRIHLNYRIYEGNYVAYDKYYKCDRFADRYTEEQKAKFENYLAAQIAKLGELSDEDYAFVLDKMLLMYSNPLKNQLEAQEEEV